MYEKLFQCVPCCNKSYFIDSHLVFSKSDLIDNNSTLTQNRDGYEFFESTRFITGAIIFPFLVIFGVIGNILSFYVFICKLPPLSTYTYLSGLAVADFLKLINDAAYVLYVLAQRYDPHNLAHDMDLHYYPYAHYVMITTTHMTAWLTVSISLERWAVICTPRFFKGFGLDFSPYTQNNTITKRRMNRRRLKIARFIVIFIPIMACILNLPCLFQYSHVVISLPICTGKTASMQAAKTITNISHQLTSSMNLTTSDFYINESFTILVRTILWENFYFRKITLFLGSAFRSFIPVVIVAFANSMVILNLWSTIQSDRHRSRRNKITLMMIIVLGIFVLCYIPDAVFTTLYWGMRDSSYTKRAWREISDVMITLNSAVNYIIYAIFMPECRKALFCHREHCQIYTDHIYAGENSNVRRISMKRNIEMENGPLLTTSNGTTNMTNSKNVITSSTALSLNNIEKK